MDIKLLLPAAKVVVLTQYPSQIVLYSRGIQECLQKSAIETHVKVKGISTTKHTKETVG